MSRLVLGFIAVVILAPVASADIAVTPCTENGRFAIVAKDAPIRLFLRHLADAAGINMAVDPELGGHVSLNVSCVSARTALKLTLPQIAASFCEMKNAIYVGPSGWNVCSGAEQVVERVATRKHAEP